MRPLRRLRLAVIAGAADETPDRGGVVLHEIIPRAEGPAADERGDVWRERTWKQERAVEVEVLFSLTKNGPG